jgi:hypothetical protein
MLSMNANGLVHMEFTDFCYKVYIEQNLSRTDEEQVSFRNELLYVKDERMRIKWVSGISQDNLK